MPPAEKPDPYRMDAEPASGSGRPGAPRPVDPSFDVTVRRDIHVITVLRAQLLDTHDIERLGDELTVYVSKLRAAKVILDMQGVYHISSSALSLLLTLKSTIEANNGALMLANVRKDLQQVFKITKLHKVLPIKESVDAAAAAF